MARQFILAALAVTALAVPTSVATAQPEPASASIASVVMAAENGVADSYVVYLKKADAAVTTRALAERTDTVAEVAERLGATNVKELSSVGAIMANLTSDQVAKLRKDPRVESIFQDQKFTEQSVAKRNTQEREMDLAEVKATRSWGIDRIDQQRLPLDGRYNAPGTGRGVTAFIMDTGINAHQEYTGRLGSGTDIVDRDNTPQDCSSHGTHVAGTVGGNTVGVATGVTLRGIRVMDCDGSGLSSNIVQAVDWMLKEKRGPSVVNNSVGGDDKRQTEVEAIVRLGEGGIFMGIASGNDTEDTCKTYYGNKIRNQAVVSSSTNDDSMSDFSNWGTCNHIFAPGSDIISASNTNSTKYTEKSGTSMAAPHVTGAAALYLEKNPNATTTQVLQALMQNSVKGAIRGGRSTPNNLLNVSFIANMNPQPNPNPNPTPEPTPTPTPTPNPTPEPNPNPNPNPGPGGNEFSNNTSYPLNDFQKATSTIQSSKAGSKKVTVTIDINHSCLQNLGIAITTPDGVRNVVKRAASSYRCQAWQGAKSETYPLNSQSDGQWKLEVSDEFRGNTGTLNGWKVTFE